MCIHPYGDREILTEIKSHTQVAAVAKLVVEVATERLITEIWGDVLNDMTWHDVLYAQVAWTW